MKPMFSTGSTEERAAVELASRYSSRSPALRSLYATTSSGDRIDDVKFEFTATMDAGGDVTMTLTAVNECTKGGAERDVEVNLYALANYYTGACGDQIQSASSGFGLPQPGSRWFIMFIILAK